MNISPIPEPDNMGCNLDSEPIDANGNVVKPGDYLFYESDFIYFNHKVHSFLPYSCSEQPWLLKAVATTERKVMVGRILDLQPPSKPGRLWWEYSVNLLVMNRFLRRNFTLEIRICL